MTLTDVLLHEAELTYGLTEKLFRRVVDSELSWRPATGKNWMTVGQLLMHCARFGCGRAIQGFVRGDWGLPEGSRLEDLGAEQHVPPVAALPSVESVEQALKLLARDRGPSPDLHCGSEGSRPVDQDIRRTLGRLRGLAVSTLAADDSASQPAQGTALLLPQADRQGRQHPRPLGGVDVTTKRCAPPHREHRGPGELGRAKRLIPSRRHARSSTE